MQGGALANFKIGKISKMQNGVLANFKIDKIPTFLRTINIWA